MNNKRHPYYSGHSKGFRNSVPGTRTKPKYICMLLLLSRFSRVWLCATPWTAAYQASPSMGFSRQEHWSGLPFPSPMHECGKWKWSRSVVSDSFFFFNFTILYWFCHISKWICHRYTCVPHPEPSSLLPPHTIPLGRPSAPAPSIQYRVRCTILEILIFKMSL